VTPLDRVRALLDGVPGLWVAERADALSAAAPDLARDVLTLADALATAERERDRLTACLARANATVEETERARYAADDERDTARSALDGLVAAVRAEREAERGHAAVRADDASRGRHLRAAEAAVDKARHATDALLSAAPPRSTVDARVVREVIAARAALIAVSSERRDVWTRVDHGQRENAASARLVAAEAALDAALAGCA
jgi:chromosome segregation ATPase